MSSPIVPVFAHQMPILEDRSRLIAWLKARQVGGSFVSTLKVVLDAAATGEDWNTMSRSQRQAEKLLQKCSKHALAINKYATQVLGRPAIVDPTKISSQKLPLLNGAVIEALPCDPDTTAGDTVNWLLDEFHLFPKSERIFGIIKPSIRMGKKMMLVSTPRGRRGKFFQLWQQYERLGKACGWSWHTTTIEDAFKAGMPSVDPEGKPQTIEQFRDQELRDIGEEMYLQEYMCIFSDKLVGFLPYKLIQHCQSDRLSLVRPVDALASASRDLFVGVDIGRRHDLTVIWIVSKSGDSFVTEACFVLDQASFAEQEMLLSGILKTGRVAGCCMDDSPIGIQLCENMKAAFPAIVEPVTFSNTFKAEIAFRLKTAMQAECFWMPKDSELAADFASIERDITEEGRVKLSAPRTSSGHGDRFWAAALAVHAAVTHKPFQLVMAA